MLAGAIGGSESEPWKLVQRRLGRAWQEQDDAGAWRKRRGRCPEGWLDERSANVAAVAAMEAHARELALSVEERRRREEAAFTVRELARQWLSWLAEVRGAKRSTVADYLFLLREPGQAHRRGRGTSPGRIMAALGDRRAADVTVRDVSRFLRSLDAEGLSPRNVNKHRQVLAAMFTYACREDTLNLPANPVASTDKRREDPPPALDYYEVEEVEALARCCERGEHRTTRRILDPAELAARAAEDRQNAEAFRILFYTGLRLGEILTLRWEDVNLPDRLLLVRRGLSAGEETLPKGRPHRFVPLSRPPQRRSHAWHPAASSSGPTITCSPTASAGESTARHCAADTSRAARPPAFVRFACTGCGTPPAASSRGRPMRCSSVTSSATRSSQPPTATSAPSSARRSSSGSTAPSTSGLI